MTTAATAPIATPQPANPKLAPVPPKAISRLAKATKGVLRHPTRYVIYGPEGVGKTTLAADAPGAILADIEDGSARVNVARYPFRDDADGHVPRTYTEFLTCLEDLTMSEHSFKTFILDSIDRLESMIWRHMMERDSGKVTASNPKGYKLHSVADYGYGKGFDVAVDEWRGLLVKLDRLRYRKQMEIILVGHAQIKTFKNPTGEDFDRYQPRANDKVAGLLKEWAEVTGFFRFEDIGGKIPGSESDRSKGVSTGRRILHLKRDAAYDAKTRLNLPDEIEVMPENPWAPLAKAVDDGYQAIQELEAAISAELERIGDATLTTKVGAATKAAVEKNDSAALQRYLAAAKARQPNDESQAQ